jgi:monodehydroascorbate reductase (NADH)
VCSRQATIVGGGYIGMETAACLSKNGLEVTLVFPEKHLMERLFTPEMAAFYEKVYTDKGIKSNLELSFLSMLDIAIPLMT